VESLSAYARQFLELMEKPDVDLIEGLSPAIAIEQRTPSHNPRSTVGTVTEIYDYLRLLYARVGTPHCPDLPTGNPTPIGQPNHRGNRQNLRREKHPNLGPPGPRADRHLRSSVRKLKKSGYVRVRVNGLTRPGKKDQT
jgi:excinuclease ABC subunit A